MSFEFAHALDTCGHRWWWLQARHSDGRIKPCGVPMPSHDELLTAVLDCFDGETYGAENKVVTMPYVPRSAAGFTN